MVGTLTTGILTLKDFLFEDEGDRCQASNHCNSDDDDDDEDYESDDGPLIRKHPRKKVLRATGTSPLDSIPNDVWSNDVIMDCLDKQSIKTFISALGPAKVKAMGLERLFCTRHGSKLERLSNKKNECPDCYMQANNLTRCRNCHIFYAKHPMEQQQQQQRRQPSQSMIHLWCQQCDEMAFCNSCLSHDIACHEQICQLSKCNHCCPNVLTNTMCGEFVCTDCCDNTMQSLDCDVCGKAACLDPNCLVCSHARMLYENDRQKHDHCYLATSLIWCSIWILIVSIVWNTTTRIDTTSNII